MPLDKKKLMAHLSASKTKPTMPKSPAIKAAEKLGQQAKQAACVNKVEKEIEQTKDSGHSSALDSMKSSASVKSLAEASLSKLLMRKLIDGVKLTKDEQKQVALVCRQAGFL